MVGVFFLCQTLIMDVLKLSDKLFEDEALHDIPFEIVFKVAFEVVAIITEGECFYKDDFD